MEHVENRVLFETAKQLCFCICYEARLREEDGDGREQTCNTIIASRFLPVVNSFYLAYVWRHRLHRHG
jgi:hypothetical protein